jgi:hypothetical protein
MCCSVGYGDLYPTTFAGRLTANIIMYVGIIGLALPIGVISSNFADVYAEHFDEVEEDAKRAEEEAAQMDGAVSLSLKQKPLKQINVQPQEIAVGKVIPASNDESKYDGRFSPPDSNVDPNRCNIYHSPYKPMGHVESMAFRLPHSLHCFSHSPGHIWLE